MSDAPVPVVGLAWHARAACRLLVETEALPASTWDASVGREAPAERHQRHEDARAACSWCPVAQACLDDHLAGYGGGVRAGYLFDDDSDYRTRDDADVDVPAIPRPRGIAECGSPRGARAHRYRDEDPCPPCLDAERAANRDRMARVRAAARELAEEVSA